MGLRHRVEDGSACILMLTESRSTQQKIEIGFVSFSTRYNYRKKMGSF